MSSIDNISLPNDSQRVIVKCLKSLLNNRPINVVLELFLKEICKVTNSEYGLIGHKIHSGDDIFFRYYGVYGMDEGYDFYKLFLEQGYIDDRAHNMYVDLDDGRPKYINGLRSRRAKKYPPGHPDIDKAIFIPLSDINKKIIGVLSLAGDNDYTDEFLEKNEYLVELCSVFLQIILERTALVRSRDNFLANISHELRTPLSGIMCVNSIIMGMDLPSNLRHHMDIIEACCSQLLDLTNDILDYTYIRSGQMHLKSEEVCIDDIIATLDGLVRDKVPPGVELTFTISPDVPRRLIGDRTRIVQILMNIIDNSCKFTKKGYIRTTIDHKTVGSLNILKFVIEDTGCGIESTRMDHIFDMVNNFNPSYLSSQCGVGLGLPIAKHMVELYKGVIKMSSTIDVGTTVEFTINLEGVDGLEELKAELKSADVILYIIDNVTRDEIFDFLLGIGSRPHIAHDVSSLNKYLKMNGTSFNFKMVLTDEKHLDVTHTMPVVNISNKGLGSKYNLIKSMGQKTIRLDPTELSFLKKTRSTYNILIAEDDPQNMEVFILLLETLGYKKERITRVTNGAELYVSLIDEKANFDIAFIDLKMPVMDGITAINQFNKYIHANPQTVAAHRRKYMIILAVTASISMQTRQFKNR
jgi:signal transduction histidine kinase